MQGGYQSVVCVGNDLGYIVGSRQAIIVVLSGTRTIEDWGYNFSSDLVCGYGGRVHQGFAALTGQIVHSILHTVQQLRGHDQIVWLTGFSRGGAIATLASVVLYQAGMNAVHVCTFGAPRAGDLAFALSYPVPHYRFENVGDLIPFFPLGDYVSVGARILLTDAGGVYLVDGSVMDHPVFEEEGSTPHGVEQYLARLQRGVSP
jgi:predicted lipase